MPKPTHQQADLMLRLYDLRREARMRTARDWFFNSFAPKTMQEMQHLVPPGSDENAYLRMVTSYWEMVCAYLNHGLLHEELFFETSGEQYLVWVRLQPILGDIRKQFSKYSFAHTEKAAQRFEKWCEKREPGRVKRMREFFATPPMQQQPR
ncbi:MAG TPA: hypothetical protein VLB32_08400 [Candidatus Acidoferrales bacterium]|nr:hypothetical protein [Candidatus Acidoferrales bacterium]